MTMFRKLDHNHNCDSQDNDDDNNNSNSEVIARDYGVDIDDVQME